MAKPNSKKPSSETPPKAEPTKRFHKIKTTFSKLSGRVKTYRKQRVRLHKSFRRSYREDYARETYLPGLLTHAMTSFKLIFKHWKTFLPFILLMTAGYIIGVGLMSEESYQEIQSSIDDQSAALANGELGNFAKAGLLLLSTITTGGLDSGTDEVGTLFTVLLFLIMWLVTVYLLRHYYAGHKIKLRDGIYNALGPFISTLIVFLVVFVQAIPLFLVIITYSAAVTTGFLATPFYALVYFVFAALMILLSLYCFASSLMALVAVTAPGMYPLNALSIASDLMAGRRLKLMVRIVYLVFVVTITYIIVMLPVILLDLLLKSAWDFLANVPIVPFMLLVTTCFVFIYLATYLFRYYRYLLDYQEK